VSTAGLHRVISPPLGRWSLSLWQPLFIITSHIKAMNELQWFHNVIWKQRKQRFLHHLNRFPDHE